MAEIDALLEQMREVEASDLHLRVGHPPRYRVHGRLQEASGVALLGRDEVERLALELLDAEQQDRFREAREIDFPYGSLDGERFRCCYFQERRGIAAVFRRIPAAIPTLEDLDLPDAVGTLAHKRGGLILVTGATGSGKSSTLAALIDVINTQYRRHVITLEDPIEFVHANKRSLIHQRGLYYDILSFETGIRAALREDPDVLLIGELRDLESIRLALTAGEMGILVFATLHTNGAMETVDRITDVFPPDEQPLARAIMSHALAGVVSQVLLRRTDRPGRVPATEILLAHPAVGNLIREGKSAEIVNIMQAGRSQGMHTLDDSLEQLVLRGVVDPEEAYYYAENKLRFRKRLPPPAG